MEESGRSNEGLKKDLESAQDHLAKATDERAELTNQLNQTRLERDEKAHDLKMARLNLDQLSAQAGFIFWHIFGVFLSTTPHIHNVTDDHRHSRLLADFPSVGAGIILTVRFLEKKVLLTFRGRAF